MHQPRGMDDVFYDLTIIPKSIGIRLLKRTAKVVISD
jgi:hypothetical protein